MIASFHALSLCLLLATPSAAIANDADIQPAPVEEETRERLGIETSPLAHFELPPEMPAYAAVLDPAPLVALIRQAEFTERALEFSRKAMDRASALFNNGELVAEKSVEAARAQLLTDEAAHQTALDALRGGYGPDIAAIRDPTPLLDLEMLVVRIAVPAGQAGDKLPAGASLTLDPPVLCEALRRAPAADPVYQAAAWLALVKSPRLVPGMSVPAKLTFPGEPVKGRLIPASAVVFHLGKAWVYQEEKPGEFEKTEVPIDQPVEGGWFVEEGKIPALKIVTTGAQMLLSKEASHPVEKD